MGGVGESCIFAFAFKGGGYKLNSEMSEKEIIEGITIDNKSSTKSEGIGFTSGCAVFFLRFVFPGLSLCKGTGKKGDRKEKEKKGR